MVVHVAVEAGQVVIGGVEEGSAGLAFAKEAKKNAAQHDWQNCLGPRQLALRQELQHVDSCLLKFELLSRVGIVMDQYTEVVGEVVVSS